MAYIRKTSARRTTKPLAEGQLQRGWSASPTDIGKSATWRQQFSLHFKQDDGHYADAKVLMTGTEAYEFACYIARQLTGELPRTSSFSGPDRRTDAECLMALAENAKQGVTYL